MPSRDVKARRRAAARPVRFDPVLLEILGNKVAAVADEMAVGMQRASRSVYVKEAADFGTAVADRDGNVFAYPHTNSVNSIDRFCGPSIRAVPDLEPGDVIVTNDPYLSKGLSTHLPDLHMIKPYYHRGRIVCYGWCFIHFMDVGGRVPSSISPSNHEIFQEGLRIPPMKLVRRGALNADFVKIFTANCRTPEQNLGDVKAMLGALRTGEQRVGAVIEQHGVEVFLAAQRALQDYAAAKARAVLRRIPDGRYEFWDYLDDDLVTRIPLRVRVRMTVRDGLVNIDLAETDPQVAAAYNVPTMGVRHPWLLMRLTSFILTHDPTMPLNVGLYRSISVNNPAGTVLNAEFPDAVGIRHATARRLNDAMTGAILKAAPHLMAAPTCGANAPLVYAEHDPKTNRRHVTVLEPLRGGMGAMKGQDGVDGRDASMSNLKNHPIESVEAEVGVIIREYDIRPDSGGAGQWRGGCGQLLTFEVLNDGGRLLARGMERLRFPAWGVAGAKPAARFEAILNPGRPGERRLGKIDELVVNAGDVVSILTPGASGYGDPYARDPEKVRRDIELGFVGRESAERDYGLILGESGAVDEAATRARRAGRVRDNVRADFDFGAEREAWESVFDDATMREINRRLYALPKSVRQERRRRIFQMTVPDLPLAGAGSLVDALKDPDAVRARLRRAIDEVLGAERRAAE